MEDIEVRRRAITFADEKGQTDEGLSRMRDDTTLQDDQNKTDHAMEDQLPDQADFGGGDFLEDGFGWGDGGLGGLDNLGAMPSVSDITLEGGQKEDSTHKKGVCAWVTWLYKREHYAVHVHESCHDILVTSIYGDMTISRFSL